jgi:hypothetical protein
VPVSLRWGSHGEYGDTNRFSGDTSESPKLKKVAYSGNQEFPPGEGGRRSKVPVSPRWGSHGEYGDTNRFSGDTHITSSRTFHV